MLKSFSFAGSNILGNQLKRCFASSGVELNSIKTSTSTERSSNRSLPKKNTTSSESVKPGPSTNKSSSNYCLDLVRKNDYESFLCTLLLPGKEFRTGMFAIRAFNTEIAMVRDQITQKEMGLGRIVFWRDAINNLYAQSQSGASVPRHPVVIELSRVVMEKGVSKKWLTNLVESRERVMTDAPFADLQELEGYCDKSVTSVLYLGLELFGVKNMDVDHAASHLGKAIGISNFIRSLPFNAQRRRVLIPRDLMIKHNVSQENVVRNTESENTKELIYELACHAHTHYEKAVSLKKSVGKTAIPVFISGVPSLVYLKRLQKAHFNPYDPSLSRRYGSSLEKMSGNSTGNRSLPSIYTKLKEDGTPDPRPMDQPDYDALVTFIKFSFPTTLRVQREIEETMKRTFVLGKTSSKSKSRIHRKRAKNNSLPGVKKKKLNFKPVKILPPKLVYTEFLELNALWKAYVSDVLQHETKVPDIQQKLNRIDLSGAILKVVDSHCDSYVNLEGIVVKESKNTFVVVTKCNETKTLPKADSVFSVGIPSPGGVMQINGNAFISRPAERSSRKIKSFMEILRPRTYRKKLLDQKKVSDR